MRGVIERIETERDHEAVRRFVERYALQLTEAGMPRMASRVFAAILVADNGNRTAAELAEQLSVSPAAISGAVRYLIQVGLVVREREPGQRLDHYRVFDDVWFETLTRRDDLLARWEGELRDGVKALGADTPAGRRIEETRQFFEFVRGEMPLMLERWRASRSG
jgi:DNA-binding transcriptional regulator GbsR (MarR family)